MGNLASRQRAQTAAKFLIRIAAILTIAMLFLIIGFILYRGFWSSNQMEYPVISISETNMDGWKAVANRKNKATELTFDQLRGLFTDNYIDWVNISSRDYDVLALYPADFPAPILGISRADFGAFTQECSDWNEALAMCASTPGAVAMIPVSAELPATCEELPVRRTIFAVHPSVTEMFDNHMLRSLPETDMHSVLSGKVRSWTEVGGPDLPVRVVLPPEGSPLAQALASYVPDAAETITAGVNDAGSPELFMHTGSMVEYETALLSTPGSVGLSYSGSPVSGSLSAIRAVRTEQGPNLSFAFLYEAPKMSGKIGGISTIIINTLVMMLFTILVSGPLGILAAVYLVEYAKQGVLVRILRLSIETLAGIPSIIFGLFGMLFFVNILGWGIGLISGVLTLTLMILPTIIRTSEEALKTVAQGLREGSLALGATKMQTVLRVVLPVASSGILTGLLLAMGRAVGETAALIFTMGSSYDLVSGLTSSTRTLAVHIYLIIAEGISLDRAFATATVLILIILFMNTVATKIIDRFNSRSGT